MALIRRNRPSIPDTGLTPSPFASGIQGDLLAAWSGWAHDPAAHCASWLHEGSPAGITVDFQLDGVLDRVDDEPPLGVDQLITDPASLTNYSGVESDPEALAIIEQYISRGWLQSFDSLSELSKAVGGEPVLNKFACISKTRLDGSVAGHRSIL